MIAVATAPSPRRRCTRGMPAADLAIAVTATPTSDAERARGLLAFGLELLARRDARLRAAAT